MKIRFESFGGILDLDRPARTLYVDKDYMRELGYTDSPLWVSKQSYLCAPITAHFALTNLCPLGCRTCYNSSGAAIPGELDTDKAKSVLDVLAGMGVFTVAFGGGEPLARADIFELAYYARQIGLTPTMTTNGFYITEDNVECCRVFDHIHVSLDGVGPIYHAVRGVDGFNHADRAIRLLLRSHIRIGVNCIVSRANYDHLDELVRYLRQMGVRDVLFLRLKPVGRAIHEYEKARLSPEQAREFFPLFAHLTRRYRLRAHVDCAMMPFLYYHQPDIRRLRITCGEGCNGGNEIIEISPTGNVRACSFVAGSAGDVHRLPDNWHTEAHLLRFREWCQHTPEECQSCKYLNLCHGGCRAIAHALKGDFYAPDPDCPIIWEREKPC